MRYHETQGVSKTKRCPGYVPGSAYDGGHARALVPIASAQAFTHDRRLQRRDGAIQTPSGHVFRVQRKRGPVWYVKYRLPDGRQLQRKLAPAWSERGRPPAGYFTRRLAEEELRRILDEARRGTLPGMVRTGVTFADATSEFLRHAERDRALKPSTLRGYRSIIDAHLRPAFGPMLLEEITNSDLERFWRGLTSAARERQRERDGADGARAARATNLSHRVSRTRRRTGS